MQAPFACVLQDRLVEGGKRKHVIILEEFSKLQRKQEPCRTFSGAGSISRVEEFISHFAKAAESASAIICSSVHEWLFLSVT